MRTKQEIEQGIKTNLPLVFGDSELINETIFWEKYNSLLDYAITSSTPFLAAETVRYQSMLLYLSLLLVAGKIFQVGKFKIGEQLITVDPSLLTIYEALIVTIIIVFGLKAYVDYQRAQFVQSRSGRAPLEVSGLIQKGSLVQHVEMYFWHEIFDVIGRTYKSYDDALNAVSGKQPTFAHISMQPFNFDRAAFSGADPDLKLAIDRLDLFLSKLTTELAGDEECFKREAQPILDVSSVREDPSDFSWYENHQRIEESFDRHLRRWFDARNDLTTSELHFQIKNINGPDSARMDAAVRIAKRLVRVRRTYTLLELITPIVLAIVAILYVRFR